VTTFDSIPFAHAGTGTPPALPEATVRGISIRGLRRLGTLLQQLVTDGRFAGVSDFSVLTTNDIVYK